MSDSRSAQATAAPQYADLPTIAATGEHHSWDYFGRRDELGTVNFITPRAIIDATREVRDGRTVSLSLPLTLPSPSMSRSRKQFQHSVTRSRSGRDDSVDGFYLQGSSQWDGLQHIRYREFGYYGGREEDALDAGELGIDNLARNGLIGRGVLVDVERYLRIQGNPADPTQRLAIDTELMDRTLKSQHTSIHPGDILLLRTGWLCWYLQLDEAGRETLRGSQRAGEGGLECPGLDPSVATAEWLWNLNVAAIAADNPALESLQVRREEGFLHRRILALLGMPIGEFFVLDELAEACAAADRWSFLFVSAPLNLPRGVGSPNNAYAVL